MQSYFSPLLDAMHAALMLHLPAPLVGVLLGALHALVFVPVAAVAWRGFRCIRGVRNGHRCWWPQDSAAPCFCPNSAAPWAIPPRPCPYWALALVLQAQARARQGKTALHLWRTGALLGLAVALRLTNALYALALVPALMCDGARLRARLLALGIVIVVAGGVFALVAGPWYWQVWQHLGNPLFPQFNGLFKSPLAAPVSIADTRWLPRNLGEHLLWPLLFTLKPQRIGDLGLVQALWAVLYALVLIAAARAVLRRRVAGVGLDRSATVVLVFVATAYVLWQAIFSIHRYLVVLELLAPVVLWICCRHAFAQRADHKAAWLIGLCALVAVVGWKDWGHEPWARAGFEVTQPQIIDPARVTVLLVGDEPQSWRVTLLPQQSRYIGVATNISETDAYRARVRTLVAERPQIYAMLGAARDKQQARVDRMNRWAHQFGWAAQPDCARLRWLIARGLRAELAASTPGRCLLVVPKARALDIAAADQAIREMAQQRLGAYGLTLDPAQCRTLLSRIGQTVYPYQFCTLRQAG